MAESSDKASDFPALTEPQSAALLGLLGLANDPEREHRYVHMHGTTRKSLERKGLAENNPRNPYWNQITEYGRCVAEDLAEQQTREAANSVARFAEELTKQAVDGMMTAPLPPVEPTIDQTAPYTWRNIDVHRSYAKEVMEWILDPARKTMLRNLHGCGHTRSCPTCKQLDAMRESLEVALWKTSGELDTLRDENERLRQDLDNMRKAFGHVLDAQQASTEALLAALGIPKSAPASDT